jgi:hypothetical protein
MDDLERELTVLLNRHSAEMPSNTPDYILAHYLIGCLDTFTEATVRRDQWYLGPGHVHHIEYVGNR